MFVWTCEKFFAAFMLIHNVNDSTPDNWGERKLMLNLRRFVPNFLRRYNGKKAGIALIVVSCTSGHGERVDQISDMGSDPPADTEDTSWSRIAYAAPPPRDAGSDSSTDAGGTNMPLNPSHITIVFPRTSPTVVVALLGNADADFAYRVRYTAEEVYVTLFLPQGSERYIEVTPADEEGNPIGASATFSVQPRAKLGTNVFQFGGSTVGFIFTDSAQRAVEEGPMTLNGPVTEEYIDGEMRQVMQGVYDVFEDHTCRINFSGTDAVYVFGSGDPIRLTGPSDIPAKAGQCIGIYPVIQPGCEAVELDIERQ